MLLHAFVLIVSKHQAPLLHVLCDHSSIREKIWEERRFHLYIVKEERLEYGQRVFMAKRRPDLYMSITIDGSDNSSYGFPYFSQKGHQDQKVSVDYRISPFFYCY